MAQLRQDHDAFRRRGAEVVAVGPDGPAAFRRYWARHDIPFAGLADPDHRVAGTYGQRVSIRRLGRMPAVLILDAEGRVRYRHDAEAMNDIPPNEELFRVLDRLAAERSEGDGER